MSLSVLMAGTCFASPTRSQVDAEDAPYLERGVVIEHYDDDDFANGRVPENIEDRIVEPDSGDTSGADE